MFTELMSRLEKWISQLKQSESRETGIKVAGIIHQCGQGSGIGINEFKLFFPFLYHSFMIQNPGRQYVPTSRSLFGGGQGASIITPSR